MALHLLGFLPMHFPARLIQLRKAANYTQQTLSEVAQLHVNQIRRYEAGTAQPTLEALIRLAKALHELHALFTAPPEQLEGIARLLVQRLVLLAQACLLLRHAPAVVSDAFIATRLASPIGLSGVVGAIDTRGMDIDALLERALPR